MTNNDNAGGPGDEMISRQLKELESRIERLEDELNIRYRRRSMPAMSDAGRDGLDAPGEDTIVGGSWLESKVGEYGLAWLGNIVLLFGITFLMQHIQNLGHPLFSLLLGYVVSGGVILLSRYLKDSYSYLARMFGLSGQLLVFYVTMRLHFFTTGPLIGQKYVVLGLLLVLVFLLGYIAVRNGSKVTAGIALTLLIVTAIISDTTHFLLSVSTVTAAIAVYLMFRHGWWRLLIYSIFLVYLAFLMWFISNPLMGHSLGAVVKHQFGFIYLFATGAIYSLIAMVRQKDKFPENLVVGVVLFNGLNFSFLLLLFVLAFFKTNFIGLFFFIASYCLAYSVLLKSRSEWKYAPAFYALYGFLALSIAIYGIYDLPRAYWLLSLQSLVVVSMALWFRNKIIVIMNTVLFVFLIAVYLGSSPSVNEVNFSFALVALATARILNWKRERLEIKTEMLRNTYLISAFVMVLIALYHAVPGQYITLSWAVAAVIYFILSFLMKNVKYRYLALGTIIAAAFYLFLVDLAKIGLVYRVVALLFLSILSIFVSIFYTRKVKQQKE